MLVLPFVLLEIWSVNRLSTLGVEINKMENTAAALKLENQVLENEIAKRSALSQIGKNAQALGFVKVKTRTQIQSPYLALNR